MGMAAGDVDAVKHNSRSLPEMRRTNISRQTGQYAGSIYLQVQGGNPMTDKMTLEQQYTAKMGKLKPCAFCGETHVSLSHQGGNDGRWRLKCTNEDCGAWMHAHTQRRLFWKWNNREESQREALIAQRTDDDLIAKIQEARP